MTLDSIMVDINNCSQIYLLPDKPNSIDIINEKIFYIQPEYKEITVNKDAKFVLFSASGAIGKSTLAKYLAHTKRGLYWNLAKIKLGENSLHGTLARAIGYDKLGDFFKNLNNGNAFMVIDAFDEADMISGRAAIDFLLNDLNEISLNSKVPSIVLLARTETAVYISEYCKNRNIRLLHYEISFFSEYNARTFILEKIQQSGKPVNDLVRQCIDQQFVEIKKLLKDENLVKPFVGYAPVLEALASAYDEERNTIKLLQKLTSKMSSADIIVNILEDLLIREHDKVCSALRERWQNIFPMFSKWDEIYSSTEQLTRIASYIIFNEIEDVYYKNEEIPSQMYDDYIEVIKGFLPQHPFILNSCIGKNNICDFTGPAFRDYVLAFILSQNKCEELAIEYFSKNQELSHCSSQLMFDFYIIFSGSRIFSNHFPFLYDSFKAKETSNIIAKLEIFNSEDEIVSIFSLANIHDCKTISENELKVKIVKDGIYFNQLSNVYIDIPCKLFLGDGNSNIRINSSSIISEEIWFNAQNIFIEAKKSLNTLLVSRKPVTYGNSGYPKFEIRLEDDKDLRISFPNIEIMHKLKNYAYQFEDDNNLDLVKYIHVVKKIANTLRKHGKDTPARDKEFIDFTVIGENKFRRSILEFLLSEGVLYIDTKETHLYKLNIEKLGTVGLNWGSLAQGNIQILESGFIKYSEWKNKNQI
ncbi:hypothetical protein DFR58_12916 [Anaerobacterium chartisolvens]|uniref:Uncharacterized protein n=1 Tax=Anaerobacterium chartisolvens TaxID=1297424 RepID=A0A369ASJ1_9FIRM|nr:hypothetical protein [Anaerobacterium chartisolvens]RCX10424.1 hypothetical protein DFR58_12916 [Anaerobacterium chartisolvens]